MEFSQTVALRLIAVAASPFLPQASPFMHVIISSPRSRFHLPPSKLQSLPHQTQEHPSHAKPLRASPHIAG